MISVLTTGQYRRWEKRKAPQDSRRGIGDAIPSLLPQLHPETALGEPAITRALSPIFIWKLLKECSLMCFICSMSRMA